MTPLDGVVADVSAYVTAGFGLVGSLIGGAIAATPRVAEVARSPVGPRLVLADHLDGEAAVLLHRVSLLDETLEELSARGLQPERRVELPLGPCVTFRSPGGQRLGLYELTRPEVDQHFAGRADFG